MEVEVGVPWAASPGKKCSLLKLEKIRKWILSSSLQKQHSPTDALQISDLQNYDIIHLCCFRPFFVVLCYLSNWKLIYRLCRIKPKLNNLDPGSSVPFSHLTNAQNIPA